MLSPEPEFLRVSAVGLPLSAIPRDYGD